MDKHLQGAQFENLLRAGTSEGDVKSTYPAQQIDEIPEARKTDGLLTGEKANAELLDDEEGESDYLAYTKDRAIFFWGDLVNIGFIKKENLPGRLVRNIKTVEH